MTNTKPSDLFVDDGSGASVRQDLNDIFEALRSNGGTFLGEPSTKYEYMWYADTILDKMSFYKSDKSTKVGFISLNNGNFFGPDGSTSNPSYTFTDSSSTGFYSPTANRIGVSNAGAETALFKVDGVDLKGHLNVTPSSGEAFIQVQTNVDNEEAYIDFVTDSTSYTDYGLRLARDAANNRGVNAISSLTHRGLGDLKISTQDTADISIETNNLVRWKINSNGALIASHSTETVPAAVNVTGGILPRGIVSKKGGASDALLSANFYNFYWTGSALECWIDTSNQGTVSLASDYRVKKDITTQTASGIDKIKQLRPVNFEFTDNLSLNFKGDGVQREGFIAHEVAEVIPSAVDGEKDAANQVQSLRMDAIVSVLTKALQEAVAKIETLEAKVAALEA